MGGHLFGDPGAADHARVYDLPGIRVMQNSPIKIYSSASTCVSICGDE
jgi:hypothetical protein